MLDLLIRGGDVVDGTGGPRRRADVGISGGRVVAVGSDLGRAHRVIDAESELGLVGAEVRVVVDGDRDEELVTLAQGASAADGRVRLMLPAWESAIALCRMPDRSNTSST